MSNGITRQCEEIYLCSGDSGYKLDDITNSSDEVIELSNNHYLALLTVDHVLHFSLLRFATSNVDGSNVELEPILDGEGVLGLRECRHTCFREKGYVFYMNGKAMTEMFEILSKYFDDMK